jgi:hypothetical protein
MRETLPKGEITKSSSFGRRPSWSFVVVVVVERDFVAQPQREVEPQTRASHSFVSPFNVFFKSSNDVAGDVERLTAHTG